MSRSKKKSSKQQSRKAAQQKNIWIAAGIAIALIVVFAGIFLFQTGNQSDPGSSAALPTEISVDEAYSLYESGEAYFLDVREPDEWIDYHAPNSTQIPLGELASRINEVPFDQPVVVVCRSGNRSQIGRDTLLAAGHPNVTSMAGGLKTWSSAGYPITSGP